MKESESSRWGTTHFVCPKCGILFILDDLEDTDPLQCPSCHIGFTVQYRYHWVYVLISLTVGTLVAHIRGHQSIIFVMAALCYSVVAMIAIKLSSFTLNLPKRFHLRQEYVQTLHISKE